MDVKIEHLSKCNLLQASEWIASKCYPMLEIYENAIGRYRPAPDNKDYPRYVKELRQAKDILKLALYQNNIIAWGVPDFENPAPCTEKDFGFSGRKSTYEFIRNMQNAKVAEYKDQIDSNGRTEIRNIPLNVIIDVDNNTIQINTLVYKDIQIDFEELQKEFPSEEVKTTQNPAKRAYTTPYIDIMLEVIEQENLTPDNQSKKDYLKTVISDKMNARGLDKSDKLADSMATLIRLPESQKGKANKG